MTCRATLAVLLAVAGVAQAAPAAAQEETYGLEVPEIVAADVTQGQIVSLVNAMIAVEHIRRDFQPRIEAAATEEARQTLIGEADAAAIAAVDKAAGISPGEYLVLIQAARQSEELTARINARLVDLRTKQANRRVTAPPAADAETAPEAGASE